MGVISWTIDGDGLVIWQSDGWRTFADDNNGAALRDVCVESIWDLLAHEGVRDLYRALIDWVQGTETKHVSFMFRCDSPDEQRTFRMLIKQDQERGEISFNSTLQAAGKKDYREPRKSAAFAICPGCKCTRVDDAWMTVEQALSGQEILKNCNDFTLDSVACEGAGKC